VQAADIKPDQRQHLGRPGTRPSALAGQLLLQRVPEGSGAPHHLRKCHALKSAQLE
jgi:hypothetical protein